MLLWTALDVLNPSSRFAAAGLPSALLPRLSALRGGSVLTAGLVFTTALSGAFVAGNDAGRAFNTFPDMDGHWVPPGVLELQPLWRNLFENTAAVQFDHRALALASTSSVAATLALALRPVAAAAVSASGAVPPLGDAAISVWKHLPAFTRASLVGMGGMVGVQVTLGISTLLLYVPVEKPIS
jgi:cytochrome c oxidase assembly protein subunit 15